MKTEEICDRIVRTLAACPFIKGIVLGGSRATNTDEADSDIDIGIYYEKEKLDYGMLNRLAKELDDGHRENLVCQEGGWGPWVNCGGWLKIGECSVDLILRDWDRVMEAVRETDRGEFSAHYQTGHPHAFLNVAYRGELAACRVLYSRDSEFEEQKQYAQQYPEALGEALIRFFVFEAGFSCELAEKYLSRGDRCYLAGLVFRAVSAMNQALFALNRQWLLNEKKAVFRIDTFPKRPGAYSERVNRMFEVLGGEPLRGISMLKELCGQVQALCEEL